MRQDAKRRERNRAAKKAIKIQLKKFEAALATGSAEQKQAEFVTAVKKLDKAAARKVIHPNAAARKKSQLAKKLNPAPAAAK